MEMFRSFLAMSAVLFAMLVPAASFAQQTTGTISGVIREQGSGKPLENARVSVIGTNIVTGSNADGTFTLRGVPAGRVELRALALGHSPQKLTVTVAPASTARADFTVASAAVQLQQVVTTATGLERKVEVGNDVAQINARQEVAEHPITNITDLLNAKAPGVQVLGGTMTGTGQRIRIRGTNSLSLDNAPIFIIDGIRMEAATGSSSIGIGGSSPSRLSDIDPNQIENVEIIKGPSASTLYGTDAANGVIVITTKRGKVGNAKWNVFAQRGRLSDRNTYPTAYTIFGRAPSGALRTTANNNCALVDVSFGRCIVDSVAAFNLFADKETRPFAPSYQEEYGADVSGGSETIRYYVQGSYNGEIGVYRVPKFEETRLLAQNGFIPGEQLRPNALFRYTFRGNMNIQLNPKADVAVSSAFISSTQRLPQTENNSTGITSNGYGGPGYKTNGPVSTGAPPRFGYRFFTPGDSFQETVGQEIARFIGSIAPNWRPLNWLTARGNFGVDFTNRVDSDLCRNGQCVDFSTTRQGFKSNNRTNFFQYTTDVSTTAQFQLSRAISSKTTGGAQYFRRTFHRNGANSSILPPGATTVTAGSVFGGSEATDYKVTAGLFLEQTLALNDRLFLTGAFRADNNSAFGAQSSVAIYPKLQASWVVSEEPFFPKPDFISQLRLRTAYGQSGTSPGANDALAFFAPTSVNLSDNPQAAIVFSAIGNPNLKPERATELEGGFDLDMFDNRISLGLTGYTKRTHDALLSRIIAPSAGVSSARFENVGSVKNSGLEVSLHGQVIDTKMIAFDGTLNYAVNSNELVSLGGIPPIIGTEIRELEGYPLFGAWGRPILSFTDINKDGILTANEVVVGDSAVFLGRTSPKVEMTFNPGFDLFNRRVRLTASVDHKAGYVLKNSTERIRCQSRLNCRGIADPSAPLAEQARAVALRDHPARTQAGYWDDGKFTKLREVAVTLRLPDSWMRTGFLNGNKMSV
ncbi:MAG: TonB-dependent receptor, partial [Gemmatimonadaceae bacterium]|nr:TonB-dependent receptor [Gemmatimonadaceae bacterium]